MLVLVLGALMATAAACQHSNDCQGIKGKPICLDLACRECQSNCDCPADKYCVTDNTQNDAYSCKAYDSDIVGKPCSSELDSSRIEKETNEKLYCGKASFDDSLDVRDVLWSGECIGGKCRVCSTDDTMCSGSRVCVDNMWQDFQYTDASVNTFTTDAEATSVTATATLMGLLVLVNFVAVVKAFRA